jgi:pimeloyl-ACP methyl ester carboxylesterase
MNTDWHRRSHRHGAVETSYLEAGSGSPLVLLHGGEFGGSAEIAWEAVIGELARRYHVIAPDILGFGASSKTVDFVDGRTWRLQHLAELCASLGIEEADFVGNSMGGSMLLADAMSEAPLLPARRIVSICGGGEIKNNEFMAALMDYDATYEGMRAIVNAMFHDPSYAADETYVTRRYESALQPGAWEAVASARFRRPGHTSTAGADTAYERMTIPTLLVEGAEDKLKPEGWAQRLADFLPNGSAAVISDSGHCPQIEQPTRFVGVLEEFLKAGVAQHGE